MARGPMHALLHHDHERLETLYDEAVEAADASVDPRTMHEIWSRFETALRAHMDAEETLVFPALHPRHAQQIDDLRAVHDAIRVELDTLGVEVDLHVIRAGAVGDLIDMLRRHAAWEDASLYLWAEEEVTERWPHRLERIAARLRGRARVA